MCTPHEHGRRKSVTGGVLDAVVEGGERGVVVDHHARAHALGALCERGQRLLSAGRIVDRQIRVLCVRRQQVLDEGRLACAHSMIMMKIVIQHIEAPGLKRT